MKHRIFESEAECKTDANSEVAFRQKLTEVAEQIIGSCSRDECHTHIDYEPIPSKAVVIEVIRKLREIVFPGYFNTEKLDPMNFRYAMGQTVSSIFEMLAEQICRAIRHDCFRYDLACRGCSEKGQEIALTFLASLTEIQNILHTDVTATFEGDPAAKGFDEIIFSYPGIFAIMVYRLAHKLYELDVPLIPRIMTEYAHSETGIDIHPGANIAERFVIDHGTGVVIGETTVIEKNVRIYQGVTLGALSLSQNQCEEMRGKKRHPTIEEDVIIYAGATILGGNTIIGARSVIGGNVWITESVMPDTTVLIEKPSLIYKKKPTDRRET